MELNEIAAEVTETQETTTNETPEVKDDKPVEPVVATEETPSEPDPTDIVKALPQHKKTAQERIAEMTWKQREAERQAEYWKQEALKKESPATAQQPQTDRPRLENFETTESYEDALLKWHSKQSAEVERETRKKEQEAEALRDFNVKAEKIRAIHDDFDEVVENPVFTKTMLSTLVRSDNGPTIAYYLGRPENYSVAKKIAMLPTELQSYEIGKLETQLIVAQKTKKIPSAPAPITPVGTNGSPAAIDESKLTDGEWYALKMQREKEKLKKKFGG